VDGGFAVAGYTDSYGAGSSDMWVLKMDSTGAIDSLCTFITDTGAAPGIPSLVPIGAAATGNLSFFAVSDSSEVGSASSATTVEQCFWSPYPPVEPSSPFSPDLLIVPSVLGDQIIVEDVENETGYVVYENALGTWYGTPSQGCLASWSDLGATVELSYAMAPNSWVVVSAANMAGESSCGTDSAGAERNAQPGWPAIGPCP
jgi:hypothetical protein